MCVFQERVKLSKFARDKMRQRRLEQQDAPPAPDPTRRDVKGERSTAVTALTQPCLSSSRSLHLFSRRDPERLRVALG